MDVLRGGAVPLPSRRLAHRLVGRACFRILLAYSRQVTNTLLTLLVDIRAHQVVVVAATNYLERLDPAGAREGRFDFKIEVPAPDEPARLALLENSLKRYVPYAEIQRSAIERAAKRWVGYSCKRIQSVGEQLREEKRKSNRTSFDFDDLMAAMRALQGRAGKIPESTKNIEDLILSAASSKRLKAIATRMSKIGQIEEMGGKAPTGIVFWGPPGTGKTEAARALAKATGWAFLQTTGSTLMADPSSWDKLIREAKDIRPVIVFLDEADDILRNRQLSNVASLTNKVLTTMDGASGKTPDIVFIAATNFVDDIDEAAMRGGRFTEKVRFETPDAAGTEKFVADWLQKKGIAPQNSFLARVVQLLEGESIAIIEAVLQEAVNQCAVRMLDGDEGLLVLHSGQLIRPQTREHLRRKLYVDHARHALRINEVVLHLPFGSPNSFDLFVIELELVAIQIQVRHHARIRQEDPVLDVVDNGRKDVAVRDFGQGLRCHTDNCVLFSQGSKPVVEPLAKLFVFQEIPNLLEVDQRRFDCRGRIQSQHLVDAEERVGSSNGGHVRLRPDASKPTALNSIATSAESASDSRKATIESVLRRDVS